MGLAAVIVVIFFVYSRILPVTFKESDDLSPAQATIFPVENSISLGTKETSFPRLILGRTIIGRTGTFSVCRYTVCDPSSYVCEISDDDIELECDTEEGLCRSTDLICPDGCDNQSSPNSSVCQPQVNCEIIS